MSPEFPTLPCSVRVTSVVGKILDGVTEGEVRSETGGKGPFHQRDHSFACVRLSGTPDGDPFEVTGANLRRLSQVKTLKMARPPHNSG